MNKLQKYAGWAILSGVGAAGILNTVLVVASGMGRLSFGNSLPALLGFLLLGIGLKKLLDPDAPLIKNSKLRKLVFAGMGISFLWFSGILLTICCFWAQDYGETPEWMLIPGAGLRGDQLSLTLMARLDTAVDYWQQHPEVRIVVSGGQGSDELISEAEAMYRYLEQSGVPSNRIYQENASTSTLENIAFSKALMNRVGRNPSKPLVIVSNRYHLFRAIGVAEVQGIKAFGVSAPTPGSVLMASYMRETLAVSKFILLKKQLAREGFEMDH